MSAIELANTLLDSTDLRRAIDQITLESVWRDLPAIASDKEHNEPDWHHALTCASLLSQVPSEQAQAAALRIAQGCAVSESSDNTERAAAAVLLERMGNRLALRLASLRQDGDGASENSWLSVAGPLRLDVIRRRLELAIPLSGQEPIAGNPFQRHFWTSLEDSRWVSAAAPTSAGKSYIVKRWFEERIARCAHFRGVYIVPTRALIEEVSRGFREDLSEDIGVYSIPWDKDVDTCSHEIYVLTQERLHFLYELLPRFAADLLFIDEAQKFGDSQRGVLLQRVLADSLSRNEDTQVVFASPMAANPELLLKGGPENARPVIAETVTVNQNLLWVNQIRYKPQLWTAMLVDLP